MSLPSFDELKKLHEENPEEFERARREMLDKEFVRIADGNPKRLRRLRGLQWLLDNDLRKYKNPVARNARLGYLMSLKLQEMLKCLRQLV